MEETHLSQRRIPPYALDKPEERVLLLGNQAVARGFLEGGGQVASTYPGTPASEILETVASFADQYNIYAEWAANEMVGFEVAAGASLCGLRAITAMKHIGVNWAMDPLMHLIFRNPKGGFILVSADDPSQHSSANEQDNRYLARIACIPCYEPADPGEAKDMVPRLFEISEQLRLPVMLRVTTRLCHVRGDVVLGPINKERKVGKMPEDVSQKFIGRIAGGQALVSPHKILHDKEAKAKEIAETFPWNRVEAKGGEKIGIIASGVSYNYAKEAVMKLGLEGKVALLKLATTYPLPERMLSNLMSGLDRLLVVEELQPFVELHLWALAKKVNPKLDIWGKLDEKTKVIPRELELNSFIVTNGVADFMGMKRPTVAGPSPEVREEITKQITPRALDMCAGCPHRSTGYIVKAALRKLGIKDWIGIGDIGCYGMLGNPPLQMIDTALCMGASIGVSQGCSRAAPGTPVFGFIGDSTFFHAGVPGLINAIYNNTPVKFVVCDNGVTAMTGFQEHPGTGRTATGKPATKIDVESVVRGVGVKCVETIDPYQIGPSIEAVIRAIKFDGPACIISRRLCASEAVRLARRQGKVFKPSYVVEEECTGCRTCVNTYGCPALVYNPEKNVVTIDSTLCMGCSSCSQICPTNAIHKAEEA